MPGPHRRSRPRPAHLLAVLALGGLTACSAPVTGAGGSDPRSGEMDVSHVHALVVDPADPARVFVATHDGLGVYTDAEGLRRVGESSGDFMGFAVGPEGRLLGSGHPGHDDDGPPMLGLISSTDGGTTWESASLSGEADFHALTADEDGIVGYDAASGLLRVSGDGEEWQDFPAGAGFYDLAADPSSGRVYGTTGEARLVVSDDGGRDFEPVPDAPGLVLVEVGSEGHPVGISRSGEIVTESRDGVWEPTGGTVEEGLQAFAVGPDGTMWLLGESGLRRSEDGGRTFEAAPAW